MTTSLIVITDYGVVDKLYLEQSEHKSRLCQEDIEQAIVEEAMRYYDNASNGNRTRGSMKKAADM